MLIIMGEPDKSSPVESKKTEEYDKLDHRLWKVTAEEFYGRGHVYYSEGFDCFNVRNSGGDDVEKIVEQDKKMLEDCNTFCDQPTKEIMSNWDDRTIYKTQEHGEQK